MSFPPAQVVLIGAVLNLCALATYTDAKAQPDDSQAADDTLTSSVLIHPPIEAPAGERAVVFTREHVYNEAYGLGDQLGRDFVIMKVGENGILRPFEPGSGGKQNEDWYTWRLDALAPFDGTITSVQDPEATTEPGTLSSETDPGVVQFDREDGTKVLYAHLREITVGEGQRVQAGEPVGKVGNNGNSYAPHVHVGAWRGNQPLQLQTDLYAEQHEGRDTP